MILGVPAGHCEFVVLVQQQPLLLVLIRRAGPHENEPPAQLLAEQIRV